jgi:hypothetical protein
MPLPPDGQPNRRETPLLAAGSIAGRALVIVVAIMTYLASMTAGTVELIASASASWRSDIAREVTIQVRPKQGRAIDQDVQAAAALARAIPGIAAVRINDKKASERLLEPWLGAGLDIGELPVPRLIELTVEGRPDFALLRQQLQGCHPWFGDRRCELTVIAPEADLAVFVPELRQCFCTDDEIARWREGAAFDDPWPTSLLRL